MISENETYYDTKLMSRIHELADECNQRGMSFMTVVVYDPGETASTIIRSTNCGFHTQLMCAAAQSGGNIDTLIFAIIKYAQKHGHSSICLTSLGVPSVPGAETVQ